jgi:hypothetical protein
LLSVGLITASVVLLDASAAVKGSSTDRVLDIIFLALMVPGMAISAIGSTVLGIGLLRNRYQPRATAVLLALALPSLLVIPDLLGHNSLGLLPLFLAWGITGYQLWQQGRLRRSPAGRHTDITVESREKTR